ncbi:MAG: cyclic nucleotide-binding domain-containing protein, partial [Geitlerinemataceae cyanobacterium]
MNKKKQVKSASQPSPFESSPTYSAILRLLTQVQADPKFAKDLSAAFAVETFSLGDELPPSPIWGGDREGIAHPGKDEDFYLICEGRVRLLAFDPQRQREVSSLVLEPGELLESGNGKSAPISVPYRAVAAGDSQIARIGATDLRSWFDAIPQLKPYIEQQTQLQQFQLFFKTQTELRSIPSTQLQQLFPYFIATEIPAGTHLAEATPSSAGRFWLRCGQILASSEKSERMGELDGDAKPIGTSWGYPDDTPDNGVAQTDVGVYQLPREHWEKAIAIAPILAGDAPPTAIPVREKAIPFIALPASKAASSITPTHSQPRKNTTKESIVFPKPIGRRIRDAL